MSVKLLAEKTIEAGDFLSATEQEGLHMGRPEPDSANDRVPILGVPDRCWMEFAREVLVLLQGDKIGFRATQIVQDKAQSAGNGPKPFSRTAKPYRAIWVAPFGPARKRPSALLRSLELAMASPALARLTADRFLTGCILSYHLEGVLGLLGNIY